ncbi:MAG: hypothetical protein QOE00_1558, partial [Ilumatobacteraceae bacterium]
AATMINDPIGSLIGEPHRVPTPVE